MTSPNRVTQSGVLLLNKPVGMSSARLVGLIKRLSGAKKVGHAGTLDPFADGLMVLGLNHGTRISRFFLHGDKAYRATILFGAETDTLDSTGEVVHTCDDRFFSDHPFFFSEENIRPLLEGFIGPQMQAPPVYSALKHQGVPLYKLARKGKPVQKEARPVEIYSLVLEDIQAPAITVSVRCSGGTYIRSLAADIGRKAGCGAHLSALTRTECCGFSLEQTTAPDTLSPESDWNSLLISMHEALPDLPAVVADTVLADKIRNGGLLFPTDLGAEFPDDVIKILNESELLIALVEFDKIKGRYNYCCVFND